MPLISQEGNLEFRVVLNLNSRKRNNVNKMIFLTYSHYRVKLNSYLHPKKALDYA